FVTVSRFSQSLPQPNSSSLSAYTTLFRSFLTDNEKDVFKTFNEINQYVVIDQAAIRQQFIDQSQSLNIMVNPKMSAKEINDLYLFAWKNGIKTLYYQHSTNAAQQFSKDKICIMCEG